MLQAEGHCAPLVPYLQQQLSHSLQPFSAIFNRQSLLDANCSHARMAMWLGREPSISLRGYGSAPGHQI